jgi:hypothetical protein
MAKLTSRDRVRRVAENAAALSGVIHKSVDYLRMYERSLDSFTGIWVNVAAVAELLTQVENELGGERVYDAVDWTDTIDLLAQEFLAEPYRSEREWKEIARRILERDQRARLAPLGWPVKRLR